MREITGEKKEKKKPEKVRPAPSDDPRNYDYPEGYGSAFVEFTSVSEARRARRNIHLLKYDGRVVEC